MKVKILLMCIATLLLLIILSGCWSLWSRVIITVDPANGTAPKTYRVYSPDFWKGFGLPDPEAPVGKSFVRWEVDGKPYDFGRLTGDITLTAVYEPLELKVLFDYGYDGKFFIDTVKYAENVSPPVSEVREGYNFIGWKHGNVVYDFDSPVTEDITLVAEWKTITFNVVFRVGGEEIAVSTVNYGDVVEQPEIEHKIYYVLEGWYDGETPYNFSTPVKSDLTLDAKLTYSLEKHIEYALSIVREHYNALIGKGYYYTYTYEAYQKLNGIVTQAESMIADNAECERSVIANLESVIDRLDSVKDILTELKDEFDRLTEREYFEEDLALLWRLYDSAVLEITDYEGGIPYPEKIAADTVKVMRAVLTMEEDKTQSIADAEKRLLELDAYFNALSESDYTAEDWLKLTAIYYAGRAAIREASGTGTRAVAKAYAQVMGELSAIEPIETHTVTFMLDEETKYLEVKVKDGETVTKPDDPTRDDYEFIGWYTTPAANGSAFDFNTAITKDWTLYAGWKEAAKTHTVTFMLDEETKYLEVKVKDGETVTKPDDPTRDDYEFIGWYTTPAANGSAFDFNTAITKDWTLYAGWKEAAKTHTVTFMLDEETKYLEVKVKDGETVTKPDDPVLDNKVFRYWSTDKNGSAFDFNTAITRSLTLYAVFSEPSAGFTVKFMVDGELYLETIVPEGERVPIPERPTPKNGYFVCWMTRGQYLFNVPVTADLTITAEISDNPVTIFTYSFYLNEKLYATRLVSEGYCCEWVTPPEIDGWYFGGWKDENDLFDIYTTRASSNKTLNAVLTTEFVVDEEGRLISYNGTAVNIVIPEGVKYILGERQMISLFQNKNIVSVVLPSTLEVIGAYAFINCSKLERIDFSKCKSLSVIGTRAFQNCSSLTELIFPDTITAFGGAYPTLDGNTANSDGGVFFACSKLKLIDLGRNAAFTRVGDNTFRNCTSLEKVVIPATVTAFGNYTFSNTPAIKEIWLYAVNPPTIIVGYSASLPAGEAYKIYIPKGALDNYLEDPYWLALDQQLIEMPEEGTDSLKLLQSMPVKKEELQEYETVGKQVRLKYKMI